MSVGEGERETDQADGTGDHPTTPTHTRVRFVCPAQTISKTRPSRARASQSRRAQGIVVEIETKNHIVLRVTSTATAPGSDGAFRVCDRTGSPTGGGLRYRSVGYRAVATHGGVGESTTTPRTLRRRRFAGGGAAKPVSRYSSARGRSTGIRRRVSWVRDGRSGRASGSTGRRDPAGGSGSS